MTKEPGGWILAEEDFHQWIEDAGSYAVNDYTAIRKSIHIYFSRQYHRLLNDQLSRLYNYWPPELLVAGDQKMAAEPLFLHETMVCYSRSESYFKEPSGQEDHLRILEQFYNGDHDAVLQFYEQEFPKIARLIINNQGTTDDAKDVFHDALVIILDKFRWGCLRLECSAGAYLYSISRNLWHERLRHRKKVHEFKEIHFNRHPDVTVDYYEEQPEHLDSVIKAIDELGDLCKQLLELYYFKNLSWEEIAAELGYISAASARNQKYKCLQKIRKQVAIF